MEDRVVIVGGSFGGLNVAAELVGRMQVTVVDAQDYWEFTPSMHTALAGPREPDGLLVKLDEQLVKGVVFVKAVAVGVEEGESCWYLETRGRDAQKQLLPFDYLVVATGCSYGWPIRSSKEETALEARKAGVQGRKRDLEKATAVLIIGGGAVGVEMAAEMVGKDKRITIVTNAADLLLDLPETVRLKARTWLKDHGVDIRFNCKASKVDDHYTLTTGEDLYVDECFWCVGGRPRTEFLAKDLLDERGFVKVGPELKSPTTMAKGLYAVGDVAGKPDAQRLASYAHFEGEYVAKAILGKDDTPPYVPPPRMVALSLGSRDGAFVYDSVHMTFFPGFLVPVLKTLIELWFIRLLPMPYALLKLLPGDAAARLWSKPPRRTPAAA